MKNYSLLFSLLFLTAIVTFSQDIDKDIALKHSLRQAGESVQFSVLETDKKGSVHYDKSKFYFWFKAQKVIVTQGGASGLLLNGLFEAFYDNKQLSRKGHFCKGLKDGEWLYWRENGILLHVEHWKKGRILGKEMFYDEKGIVSTTIENKKRSFTKVTADSLIVSNYAGTKKTITTFDKTGAIVSTKKYKNGVERQAKEKTKISSVFKKKDKTTASESKEKKSWFGFLKKKEGTEKKTEKPVKEEKKKKEPKTK